MRKNEHADASLTKLFPLHACKSIQQARRKQSTVAERPSPSKNPKALPRKEPTPFRCSGPHSPSFGSSSAKPIGWRVSQARLRKVAETCSRTHNSSYSYPFGLPDVQAGELCSESLVSSIREAAISCFIAHALGFSLPNTPQELPSDAFRILAEPSNNIKETLRSQYFCRKLRGKTPFRGASIENRLKISLGLGKPSRVLGFSDAFLPHLSHTGPSCAFACRSLDQLDPEHPGTRTKWQARPHATAPAARPAPGSSHRSHACVEVADVGCLVTGRKNFGMDAAR